MIPIRDSIRSRTVPFVNLGLIAVNCLFFVYEVLLPPEALERFMMERALVPAKFFYGFHHQPLDLGYTVYPLLLSMFLHGGWAHLLGNMLYLYIFGDNVEDRMGHFRYLVFYLTTGACAAAAHLIASPRSGLPAVGASGAIAGVMGAYFLLYPHARVVTLIPIFFFIQLVELPAVVLLFFWFAMQFLQGSLALSHAFRGGAEGGGVAWWAHIGGFVSGAVLVHLFRRRVRSRGW